MKRVMEACLCQTLHFSTREPFDSEYTTKLVNSEVAMYKNTLDEEKSANILSEGNQADGSIIMKIVRQNANYPVGQYLD